MNAGTGQWRPGIARSGFSRYRLALLLAGLMSVTSAAPSWSQSCDMPYPLSMDPDFPAPDFYGNTCASEDWLDHIGGLFPSPHRDIVHRFVASGWPDHLHVMLTFDASVTILDGGCANGQASWSSLHLATTIEPVSDWVPLGDLDLVDGVEYLLVVSGHPDSPASMCGFYGVSAYGPPSPPVFRNGFD